jgi:hypothetical protein
VVERDARALVAHELVPEVGEGVERRFVRKVVPDLFVPLQPGLI